MHKYTIVSRRASGFAPCPLISLCLTFVDRFFEPDIAPSFHMQTMFLAFPHVEIASEDADSSAICGFMLATHVQELGAALVDVSLLTAGLCMNVRDAPVVSICRHQVASIWGTLESMCFDFGSAPVPSDERDIEVRLVQAMLSANLPAIKV